MNEKCPITPLDVFEHKGLEYSREDCINDILSVVGDFPERKITRDLYRQHAEIPERVWLHFFGTFQEFSRQAGINYTRLENKVLNRIAQHASVDHLRTLDLERKNYGNLYRRDHGNRFKTMIACSDLHDKECDKFFLRVLNETIKTVQPDTICVAGDLFDCPEFSKYTVDPREWDVVGRIQAGLDILANFREIAPDAEIDLVEGNHDARLLQYISNGSPGLKAILSDLHGFTVRSLFKLDQYEVNYIAQGDLFTFTDAQTRKEIDKNYKIYWNSVIAHHFPHGRHLGLPGFNGHHHKHIVWSEYDAIRGPYEWHQIGAGHVRQASYTDGAKWQNGFIIVNVDTWYNHVKFDYVDVGTTFAVAGGTWFYRNEDEMYPFMNAELRHVSNR